MKKIILCLLTILSLTPCVSAESDLSEKTSTHFIVYYKGVPDDFVDKVIEFAERYYDELTEKLGFTRFNYWTWENRAKVYIYPDKETFQKETKQPEWAGGAASYDQKTIWTFPREAGFFDSLLPHEIGHIVFREVVGSKHEIPLWLEEGVASYMEEAKRIGAEKMVIDAIKNNTFIPLADLSKINSEALRVSSEVSLFYAESVSLITYLIEKFGVDSFNNFCQKLKDGKKFDDALGYAYFDIRNSAQLSEYWEESLREKAGRKVRTML